MSISACNLSIVPLRSEALHRSEMVSQVLFGENFEIIEESVDFTRIRLMESKYEGWIQNYQFGNVILSGVKRHTIVDIGGAKAISGSKVVHLLHGTSIPGSHITIGQENYIIEGVIRDATLSDFKTEFPKLIQHYKNTPYMWGGRSIFGIDCSGLSQLIYKHFGIALLRDAYQQAESGEIVDFLTEIKPGDLAFFDNKEGRITHVGIMIDSETILHASGSVRIDKMDSQGIFNAEQKRYTHNLRIVKRYF